MRVKGAIKRGISPFFGLECRDLATQVFANVMRGCKPRLSQLIAGLGKPLALSGSGSDHQLKESFEQ
jgi:hypothetical protein